MDIWVKTRGNEIKYCRNWSFSKLIIIYFFSWKTEIDQQFVLQIRLKCEGLQRTPVIDFFAKIVDAGGI